jgi:glycerol kinase
MILAIDAGTTGVTAVLVDQQGKITKRGYSEFQQHYPQPGFVEHDLNQIWDATLKAVSEVIDFAKDITAIGITNQRETVGIWDRNTLEPLAPAIVWQDRRTTKILQDLEAGDWVSKSTGLPLDPYFSASKLRWIALNNEEAWDKVLAGSAVVGTIDTFLIAKLTGDHLTDASNASRTQLFDIHTGSWSTELLNLFEIPESALAKVMNSSGNFGKTKDFFGLTVPVSGVAGDQQAALFGQAQFDVGGAKCTYGTGAFILQNTGSKAVIQDNGLITTVAWQLDGKLTYANEGSVFVSGAAVQWLRDELKIINSAAEIEELALTVKDNGGVIFVPALTGLGAPYWIPDARGSVFGLTRGTERGHLARATLEALAFQVRDVFDAMDTSLSSLRVDGGAASNNLLLQIQADLLQIPIERPSQLESTALGAAYLAGLGNGLWTMHDLKQISSPETIIQPKSNLDEQYLLWKKAVQATIEFAR